MKILYFTFIIKILFEFTRIVNQVKGFDFVKDEVHRVQLGETKKPNVHLLKINQKRN